MGTSQSSGRKNPFEGYKQEDDGILHIAERPNSMQTQGSPGPSALSGSIIAQYRPGQEVPSQKHEHERPDEFKGRPGFRELFNQPHIQAAPPFNIPWNILRRNVMSRSKARERIVEPEGIVASTFSTSNDYRVLENKLNNEGISHGQLDCDEPGPFEDSSDGSKFTSEDGAFAEGG